MTWFPDIDDYDDEENLSALLFHRPTLEELTDGTMPWPKPGKVKVGYRMSTEPWDMLDNRVNEMLEEDTKCSIWQLTPTNDAVNWRGFFPTFICEGDGRGGVVTDRDG